MQFTNALVLAFAALAAAAGPLAERKASVCPAGQTPQCCQLDVEGILDLPCSSGEYT